MADLLDSILGREIPVDLMLKWLQNKNKNTDVPEQLRDASKLRYEFVPFFLNYLRDQTLPLLQNCKSVTPSPVKTPSAQKHGKPGKTPCHSSEVRNVGSANRVQLFSPVDRPDLSPLCSLDTQGQNTLPGVPVTPTERNNKASNYHEINNKNKHHKQSPRDCRNYQRSTVDPNKSKHKISLGDFLTSPEIQGHRKKKSPLVSIKKDRYREDGQSPSPGSSRRWNGKKKQATPDHLVSRLTERCGDTGNKSVQEFNLANTEDFPTIGQASQTRVTATPVQPVRRINPTPVKGDMKRPQNTAFLDTANTVWSSTPGKDNAVQWSSPMDGRGDVPLVFDMERALLRKEKAKRQEQKSCVGDVSQPAIVPVTPTKAVNVLKTDVVMSEPVVAKRSEVTHKDQISLLADLYAGCMEENLLPNLNVELYFLVQLLTIQEINKEADPDMDSTKYFVSVHNAVYFSVLVLEKQRRLLSLLDRSTIRLLADNPRVMSFSPDLADHLNRVQEATTTKSVMVFSRSPIGGVSFQADTDNRENFPSQQSFLHFKKQRDQFYELIREWEDSHMNPGWQMTEKMGNRIKSLVQSRTELTNHIHLARLFQSQLLTMCKGDQSYKTDGDDEQVALLSQLKRSNPEKFKRLQERFVTPMTIGGPCPPPSFPGCQEFFRDFILAASCHSFNHHLADIFSAKISELDCVELSETDVETEEGRLETVVDEEEKEQFVASLLVVRLVGKFLGFLTFLPYQTTERLPDSLLPSYLEIRAKVTLPLNILELLERACRCGRLVMTVPWVVEFLSMLDPLSPLLPYFQNILSLLLEVYRFAVNQYKQGAKEYNHLLLIFSLGWFFELSSLPDGYFFHGSSQAQSVQPLALSSGKELDSMDLIDQQVLYTCCPYLVEIRSLLLEFAVGRSNRKNTVRKITPVSADGAPVASVTEKQLQLQMEENFFHNHPASLKRVVEFVAERTASNYIKKLRASSLNGAFSSAKECVNKLVSSLSGVSPNARLKEKLFHDVHKEAASICDRLRDEVTNSVHKYCHSKIVDILPLLLPEEQVEAVVSVAVRISCRQAEERVHQWVNNHITTRIFQREMSEELEKMCRPVNLQKMFQTGPEWRETALVREDSVNSVGSVHDDNIQGPTDSLTETKVYVRDVILYHQIPTEDGVSKCIQKVCDTLTSRQDLLTEGYRYFAQMLQDLVLFMLCSHPELWTDKMCFTCWSVWNTALKDHVQFGPLLSPRLLHWIKKSTDPQRSWKELSSFVIELLHREMISMAQIQKTAVKVVPLSRQLGMLREFVQLLIYVLNFHKSSINEAEDCNELVDVLHHSCGDQRDLIQQIEQLMDFPSKSTDQTAGTKPDSVSDVIDSGPIQTNQKEPKSPNETVKSVCLSDQTEAEVDPIMLLSSKVSSAMILDNTDIGQIDNVQIPTIIPT